MFHEHTRVELMTLTQTKMLRYLMYEYYAQRRKLCKILGGGGGGASGEGTIFQGRYGGMLPQNCNYAYYDYKSEIN